MTTTVSTRTLPLAAAARDMDSGLKYTLLALGVFLALGAIIVPLSIPDTPAGPTKAQALATTLVTSLAAKGITGVDEASAATRYGTTGGELCTMSPAAARASLATPIKGTKRTVITKASLAQARVVVQTYCPAKLKAWDQAT